MCVNHSVFLCLSSGVGRTGAFCLLYAALQELEAGNGIPDLPLLVKKMRQQRKNMLQEKVQGCLNGDSNETPSNDELMVLSEPPLPLCPVSSSTWSSAMRLCWSTPSMSCSAMASPQQPAARAPILQQQRFVTAPGAPVLQLCLDSTELAQWKPLHCLMQCFQ